MEAIFINYELLEVFGYSFESPLCYGCSKTVHETLIELEKKIMFITKYLVLWDKNDMGQQCRAR
jgi:hypothetical protein